MLLQTSDGDNVSFRSINQKDYSFPWYIVALIALADPVQEMSRRVASYLIGNGEGGACSTERRKGEQSSRVHFGLL